MLEGLSAQCQQLGQGSFVMGGAAVHAAILIPLMLIAGIGMFLLVNLVLKWLWNITMPDVFGLKQISFWQTFRLLLIACILFGGGSAMIR